MSAKKKTNKSNKTKNSKSAKPQRMHPRSRPPVAHRAPAPRPAPSTGTSGSGAGTNPNGVATGQVVVRMYDVGFGDAFLVFLPAPHGPKKVLFDCGSIKKDRLSISEVVDQIIADVTDSDGVARIDLVVCTHRHRDHISGFASEAWAKVQVKEVWLPWTEDPKDPQAKKIHDAQTALALQLTQSPGVQQDANLLEVAQNALTNADAMETVHHGFDGDPVRRFLPTRQREEATFKPDILPGVTVHVMGPSHDSEVIRDMDPPAGAAYLRLSTSLEPDGSAPWPFHRSWALATGDFHKKYRHMNLSAADRKELDKAGSDLEQAVTVALDKAINGTSLMLLFEVGKARLLFPGDAQWGTWRAALDDEEWRGLLKKPTFYKIGHHGSHNATPREFVEQLIGSDFWAMASVKPVAQWESVPKVELLEALRERSEKVARSDEADEAPNGFMRKDGYLEARLPI